MERGKDSGSTLRGDLDHPSLKRMPWAGESRDRLELHGFTGEVGGLKGTLHSPRGRTLHSS